MSRHRLFGSVATLAVAIALVLGFLNLGGRGNQRNIRADRQRAIDLGSLSLAVNQWYKSEKKLPSNLHQLARLPQSVNLVDPVTATEYEYIPGGETQYQLCATFATEISRASNRGSEPPWTNFNFHKPGRQCFQLASDRD